MAMPRYRYAIGQAPVRFPSPAPSREFLTGDLQPDQTQTRPNRLSIADDNGGKREKEATSRLKDAHRKTKSMINGDMDSNLQAPSIKSEALSRRSSLLSVAGMEASRSSESLSVKTQRRTDEKSPLNNKNQDMLQRQVRPASTSISSSSRPSSLFWTEPEIEAIQSRNIAKGQKSYGATETTSISDQHDPYGYRALAGPALLPSYHEEQQRQQVLREMNSRTCGPNIAILRKYGWAFVALVGTVVTVFGVLFVLL